MNQTAKKILPWSIVIIAFTFGLYLNSQRQHSAEDVKPSVTENTTNETQDHQELALKQKLVADFENAFLKQYTPLIGCEEIHSKNPTAKCIRHLEQAKNEFKEQFIKTRGLPKNVFEELKLSQADQ